MTRHYLVMRLINLHLQCLTRDVELVVSISLEAISATLSLGRSFEIRNFGSFGLNFLPPRLERSFKTNKKVNMPASCKPHFKSGKELGERICMAVRKEQYLILIQQHNDY